MKTRKWILIVGFCGASVWGQAQNRLEVVVQSVKDTTGTIRVGLFSDAKTFLKKPVVAKLVKASDGKAVAVFEDVPSGAYAISIIHDSNRNGELDSNLFGMPKEGFGFSNDAMGSFGPPSFVKASFTISEPLTITVKTRYL